MTAILDIFFVVLKLLVWAGVLFLSVRVALRIRSSRLEQGSVLALIWRCKSRLLLITVTIVVAVMLTSVETAYRLKVSPTTANPTLDKTLREVDQRPKPNISPSKSNETWEEIQKRNREENEKSREEFKDLPDKK